ASRRAIGVDKTYVERSGAQGVYPMMYVAHNFQFLWAAAALEGRSAESLRAARDLAARFPEEMLRGMAKEMPGIDYFVAAPLFAQVRFGKWKEILATPAPAKDFAYLTAVWHFARGMALAAPHRAARHEQRALPDFLGALPPDAMIGPLNKAISIIRSAWLHL